MLPPFIIAPWSMPMPPPLACAVIHSSLKSSSDKLGSFSRKATVD